MMNRIPEIIEETYAMNRAILNGFCGARDHFNEFFAEILYGGDFKYIIEQ